MGQRKHMGISARPAPLSIPPFIHSRDESERQKMTFQGLDLEKSWNVIYSPTAHEALSTGKWVTSFWTLIWSGPETWLHSQGLRVRQRAGWGARLLYWKFPWRMRMWFLSRIKALDIAIPTLSSLPWLSPTQAKALSESTTATSTSQWACGHRTREPKRRRIRRSHRGWWQLPQNTVHI